MKRVVRRFQHPLFDRSAPETKRSIDARDTPEPINETYPGKLGCDTDWSASIRRAA
jgi:acetone carboxylase gamma subunit